MTRFQAYVGAGPVRTFRLSCGHIASWRTCPPEIGELLTCGNRDCTATNVRVIQSLGRNTTRGQDNDNEHQHRAQRSKAEGTGRA
jgi:hypothetical protein